MLLSFFAGILLGAIFFGGLRWTIARGLSAKQPAPWFLGSFIFRTGAVLAGLYFVGRDHWQRMLVCLAGFLVARFIILRFSRTPSLTHETATGEACHAP